MAGPIRVYVLDDHAAVRSALADCLGRAGDIELLGQTGEADDGLLQVASLLPDVVLTDPKRSDGRGLELINWIIQHCPAVRVIVLTSYPNDWEEWATRRAGAAGYVLKDIGCGRLLQSLYALAGIIPEA
jgi:DNA-binding NarL/FixJ family response regulator